MGKTFGILGGDNRFCAVADCLSQCGYAVWTWGLNNQLDLGSAHRLTSIYDVTLGTDTLILPIPILGGDGMLNAPFSEQKPDVAEILEQMHQGQTLAGGMLPSWFCDAAQKKEITVIDYGKREDFLTANAIPTAEGAIGIAMRELKQTLWDSSCLVLGFGRIGKLLAGKLSHFCRDLTVCARKAGDLAMIAAMGYKKADYTTWYGALRNADVIFNTVPQQILDQAALSEMKQNALVIDLASRPGGTDFKAAEKLGIKTVWALSLPGKTAPYSAGKIIAESILAGMYEVE